LLFPLNVNVNGKKNCEYKKKSQKERNDEEQRKKLKKGLILDQF